MFDFSAQCTLPWISLSFGIRVVESDMVGSGLRSYRVLENEMVEI